MPRNYSPEKKADLAKQAKEDYHNKYKFQRKILYLCRKLDINRDEFVLNYPDDNSAFLELKRIELEKFLEKNDIKNPLPLQAYINKKNNPVKPCIKTEETKSTF